ncbi:N4-gp56 family major capsid protein [Endozoicomonas sp. G2_1]|uniref:N4-gp56 family major capsid protein n=1 Tax=Endozoicomonas sp. G2_1 TaxID=2821091 RepID=UPI001ADBEE6F|nr:N4-gp56 family major capsid protein [Endozoicomonas sp. G2_1]MBO9492231.1 N4-gp56 family major capsid protein [Endozoicomonas sp. G2_1]
MPVNIPEGSKQKLFNAALFAAIIREPSFLNMLTGAAKKAPKGMKEIGREQTDAGSPVVRVSDLSKSQGKEVTVDIIHRLTKEPTMGDTRLAGRGDNLTFANDTLKIDQYRHMVDDGGAMTQQEIAHNLTEAGRQSLMVYYKQLMDEVAFYHFCGARGTAFDPNYNIVPLEAAKSFAKIMVNELVVPNYDSKFYGGDATSVDQLDSADLFSLESVDNMWLHLQEMANPIPYIRLTGDKQADESPMYVQFVTPRQWNDFQTSASAKDWNQMIANAQKRSSGFNHQVFKGDCLMYRNILVKPMNRRVRWNAGDNVDVAANDKAGTVSQQTAAVPVERSILVGAQAVASAYGKTKQSNGRQFNINKEMVDHDNACETSINWVQGLKKLSFEDSLGYRRDHGILTLDTAVK